MKKQLAVIAALAAACVSLVALAPVASAARPTATANLPQTITGTIAATSGGGTFTGTLSNLHFVNTNGVLAVAGNLTGTLTDALGGTIGSVTNVPITLPIGNAAATGTCTVLDLTLGPLHLDLLGLVVDLYGKTHVNPVVVTINAVPSQGLLGQLLCGLAGGGGINSLAGLQSLLSSLGVNLSTTQLQNLLTQLGITDISGGLTQLQLNRILQALGLGQTLPTG